MPLAIDRKVRMNKFTVKMSCGVSVVCLLGLAAPVMAESVDWTGFYLGGQVGRAELGAVYSSEESTDRGSIMGLHAGYNFQTGNIVYGVEADYSFGDMQLCEDACPADSENWVSVDSTSSIRARVGMTFDDVLVYATAGVGDLSGMSMSSTGGSDDGTIGATGITVLGLGAEWAVSEAFSVRIEVMQYQVKGMTLKGTGPDVDPYSNFETISVGFSSHF
jgi:opacity protein-like surface antigen